MNKQKVNWLISMMVIALLGVVTMQVVWMQKAIHVKNDLFDKSVNEALNRTANRLEMLADVYFLDYLAGGNKIDLRKINGLPYKKNFQPRPIRIKNDTIINNRKIQRRVEIQNNNRNNEIETHLEIVVFDSILDNLTHKIDQSYKVIDNDSINWVENDSIDELQIQMDRKSDRLKRLVKRMEIEKYRRREGDQFQQENIHSVLKDELIAKEIFIDFEFVIQHDSLYVVQSEAADSAKIRASNFVVNLNPNEIYNRNQQLRIYFPERKKYIWNALIFPISLSILFSSFIILSFILSIHYIVKQKKISEMKSDFINNMTHEFKTPLATISVATDTIVNDKIIHDPEKVKNFASIIKKENLKMNDQVETILQIASIDRQDFRLQIEPINIHSIIEKAVAHIQLQISNRLGQIHLQLDAQNPIVSTDSKHLFIVLNNLLDNANKYSSEVPTITIHTKNSATGIWISISDQGIGMSKQEQEKIFEKFFRATSGNIHNVKGFGLGLSFAHSIIKANQGEINVTSALGKGSTFHVFLPFTLKK